MMLQNIAAVWSVKADDIHPELLVSRAVWYCTCAVCNPQG